MAETGGAYDSSGLKKARKSNFSPEEIEALVTTVNKNYHILYGVFAKRAVNKQARHKVWLDVTRRVNRVSVEKRTLQEVKNKWKKCQHMYKESESVDDIVLPNVWEPLATLKGLFPSIDITIRGKFKFVNKVNMKTKTKHRGPKNNKTIRIRQCTSYEPDFKKAVVLYAEQKSTSEAKRRYGISESNIRRWRRLKNDIIEKASNVKSTKKSNRSANTFENPLEDCDSNDCNSSLDSMPLEQRLKAPPEQEPILQSQPLSPTKLKVTRQSSKPSQLSPKPVTPEPPNEEVCLRWNSHHSNMQSSFPNLLMREQYVDATLVAEGRSLKCHRLILSSCSPYFEEVLNGISPFQHPVLFMKDIPFWVLKSLCDFMYAGEVHIFQNKLEELLAVAESLKIKGLAHKIEGSNDEVKTPEPARPIKEDKKELRKEEKEVKEKKRNSQQFEPTPKSNFKAAKSVHSTKKAEKASKESLSKQGILDPLDLLEPVYEEVTKESMPPKLKEIKNIPVKKGKIKKRKISDEREESPPPVFRSRKGTRSRPRVKVPKYYHTHYERVTDATIVREPHTEPDPLLQIEEIKAEPLDLDDDVIEIEDNVIEFSSISHDEEIIGNYDSPLVNLNDKIHKGESQDSFKKLELVPQPIIMDVHSIAEKSPNSVQIVDLGQLKEGHKVDDPLDVMVDIENDKVGEDPLNFDSVTEEKGAQGITITNVQSIVDLEDDEKSVDVTIEDQNEKKAEDIIEQEGACCDFRIEKVVSEVEEEENIVVLDDLPEIQEKSSEEEKVIETPVICIDVTETENTEANTSATEDVICLELPLVNSVEQDSELEVENCSQALDISNNENEAVIPHSVLEENVIINDTEMEMENCSQVLDVSNNENEAIISHSVLEENVIINDTEMETTEVEEIVPEPGFHIAKVASEQFLVTENMESAVISEDCAAELGFQITNVMSEHVEDADLRMSEEANTSNLGTFSNHLSEGEGEVMEKGGDTVEPDINMVEPDVTRPVENETMNEDTQFLAESLERLLDE